MDSILQTIVEKCNQTYKNENNDIIRHSSTSSTETVSSKNWNEYESDKLRDRDDLMMIREKVQFRI